MQSIYAMHQNSSDDLTKQEKFLYFSLESGLDLYLTMLAALLEIRTKEAEFIEKSKLKHLATKEDKNPNTKFVDNAVLIFLSEHKGLSDVLEVRNINNWSMNDDYIYILLDHIKRSDLYKNYLENKTNSFENDKAFIYQLFNEVIVPNEKLYEYLEDNKLTWIDDIPMVNTFISKQLKNIKEGKFESFSIPKLFKDTEDKEFVSLLFRKTVLNEEALTKEFIDKTVNWEIERIAEIDTIILKMAICEILKFPSIPTKVTINEYLEIAKEYSTPKSSIFINGILDNLVKELQLNDRLKKTGRGLM